MRGIQKYHNMSHLVKNMRARFFESGPCPKCQVYSRSRENPLFSVRCSMFNFQFLAPLEQVVWWCRDEIHHNFLCDARWFFFPPDGTPGGVPSFGHGIINNPHLELLLSHEQDSVHFEWIRNNMLPTVLGVFLAYTKLLPEPTGPRRFW